MQKIINFLKNYYHKNSLKKIKFGNKLQKVEIAKNFKFIYSENIFIDNYVYIGPNSTIYAHGQVNISRGTIIGPNITIYTANHNFSSDAISLPYDKKLYKKNVFIEENVWIGGNVILLPGAKISEGCIIGAGSVIAKEIAPYSIVVGNPCKVIGTRNIEKYKELKESDAIYLKNKAKM